MTLTQIKRAGLDGDALDRVFTIGASGSSAYTFQGEGLNGTVNNPTLYLTRGKTYRFENGTGAHAIRIQSADNGTNGTLYNTGVTNNNTTGTVIVEVQHDAPDVLYYQCASHGSMKGILYITGALADGGVTTAKIAADAVTSAKIADDVIGAEHIIDDSVQTAAIQNNAVSTDKIADDAIRSRHYGDNSIDTAFIANNAVTTAKIADHQITDQKLASNSVTTPRINGSAVTTAKIADEAVTLAKLEHGTSSNDGKFLRANNGADPTFETITGTTINNNATNRVITGEGGTTLNGESQFTYDGRALIEAGTAELEVKGSVQGRVIYTDSAATSGKRSYDITSNSDRLKVRSLNDNFTSATDAILVEGSTSIVTLAANPYWIGYMNATFSSSTNGWVTLPVNTTRYQVGSNWDTSNYKFTVPISGLYQITINAEMTHVNNQSWIYLMPRVSNNDVTTKATGITYCDFSPTSHSGGTGAAAYFHYSRTEVVRLIKDQEVRFQTYVSGTQYNIGANDQNCFSIVYIGQS